MSLSIVGQSKTTGWTETGDLGVSAYVTVTMTDPDDSDSMTGVGRSGGDTGVEALGLINSDGTVGFGQGDNAGVAATGLVNSDSGADAERSDEVAGIGLVDSISSGTLVYVSQLDGGVGTEEVWAHDDNMGTSGQQGHDKGSVFMGSGNSANDGQVVDVFGKATGTGEPGNHGVGDGLQSYTCNPNDGVRSGRYISGRGDDMRPSGEVPGRDDERDVRRLPRTVRRQADTESTSRQTERLQDASDGAAIVGDPMSLTRLRNQPRRTVKLPVRFKDFDML